MLVMIPLLMVIWVMSCNSHADEEKTHQKSGNETGHHKKKFSLNSLERYLKSNGSKCSKAFSSNILDMNVSQVPVLNMSSSANQRLKIINIGDGTTGTHTLHEIACKLNDPRIENANHWKLDCHSNHAKSAPVHWFQHFFSCFGHFSRNGQGKSEVKAISSNSELDESCKYNKVLSRLREALLKSFQKYDVVQDVPYPYFYPEILQARPDIIAIQTIRDPVKWAASRLESHKAHVYICKESLWNKVNHPFDILRCLKDSENPFEDIVRMKELSDKDLNKARNLLARAFVKLNTYNALITPPNQLHIICLFDGTPEESTKRSRKELRNIWNYVTSR